MNSVHLVLCEKVDANQRRFHHHEHKKTLKIQHIFIETFTHMTSVCLLSAVIRPQTLVIMSQSHPTWRIKTFFLH